MSLICNKNLHSKEEFSSRKVPTRLLFCTDVAEAVRKIREMAQMT